MRNLKNKLERIYRKAARTLVERGVEGPPQRPPHTPPQSTPQTPPSSGLSQPQGQDASGGPGEPGAAKGDLGDALRDLGDSSGDPPAPATPPQSPQGPTGSTLEDFFASTVAEHEQKVCRPEQAGLHELRACIAQSAVLADDE